MGASFFILRPESQQYALQISTAVAAFSDESATMKKGGIHKVMPPFIKPVTCLCHQRCETANFAARSVAVIKPSTSSSVMTVERKALPVLAM
jgi:hypothetical protein